MMQGDFLLDRIITPFISLPNFVGPAVVFACVLGAYLFKNRAHRFFGKNPARTLSIVLGVWLFLRASAFTVGQYIAWSHMARTIVWARPFLEPRFFIGYAALHFWLAPALAALCAAAFYGFLVMLKRFRERFFEPQEEALGFLTAFMAGWPGFVLFLPITFLSVVVVSIVRSVFLGKHYTTLGAPFLLAAFCMLLWGAALLVIFHLGVLLPTSVSLTV